MKYDALRYFVEVAEQGSINKASERLYISQPNLSTALRNLETDLQLSLLKRNNRGIQLTEDGKEIYFFAKRIFNELDNIEQYAETQSHKIPVYFSMSISGVFLCGEVFNRYFERNRGGQMQFNLYEVGIEAVLDNVAGMKSDLGVAVVNNLQMAAFKRVAEIKNLSIEELGTSPLVVLLGEYNPLYRETRVPVERLLAFPFIHLPVDYFARFNWKARLGDYSADNFANRIVINHCHSIVHLLKTTSAQFFSNLWSANDLKGAGIHALQIQESALTLHLMLVRRKRETLLPSVESFQRIFVDHYRPMRLE